MALTKISVNFFYVCVLEGQSLYALYVHCIYLRNTLTHFMINAIFFKHISFSIYFTLDLHFTEIIEVYVSRRVFHSDSIKHATYQTLSGIKLKFP